VAIGAVVFDIGGVLEITPPTDWQQRWADELALPVDELERRIGSLWGPGEVGAASLALIEQQTADALGLDSRQLQRLTEDIWAEYLGTLNEPLAQYFDGLRPRFRTGILSNSLVGAREREQSAYGLQDMCDVLVYSHEEGMSKPDLRFYQLICDRLGVAPHETIFLDDKLPCVQGARSIGMHAVQFVSNDRAIAELSSIIENPARRLR
jgi:epoxide hydrolase-like predicted phosphatase